MSKASLMLLLCRYPGSWIGPATDAELSRRDIGARLELCQREPLVRAGIHSGPRHIDTTSGITRPQANPKRLSRLIGPCRDCHEVEARRVKRIAAKAAPVLASPSRGK